MSRITKKGQVTIPKNIRDLLNIRPNDIGDFAVKEGSVVFTVKRGTILDAHRKRTDKDTDFSRVREYMKEDIAKKVAEEE